MTSHDAGAFVLQVSDLPIEWRAVRERRPLSTRMLPLYIREQTPPARSPTANFDLKFAIHIGGAFGRLQAEADMCLGMSNRQL